MKGKGIRGGHRPHPRSPEYRCLHLSRICGHVLSAVLSQNTDILLCYVHMTHKVIGAPTRTSSAPLNKSNSDSTGGMFLLGRPDDNGKKYAGVSNECLNRDVFHGIGGREEKQIRVAGSLLSSIATREAEGCHRPGRGMWT